MATAAMKAKPRSRRVTDVPEIEISVVREIATHSADIRHMQEDMDRVLAEMAQMRDCLNNINKTLSEAKGGWRMLMMFGGAGGALGAILTQVLHSLPGWGK